MSESVSSYRLVYRCLIAAVSFAVSFYLLVRIINQPRTGNDGLIEIPVPANNISNVRLNDDATLLACTFYNYDQDQYGAITKVYTPTFTTHHRIPEVQELGTHRKWATAWALGEFIDSDEIFVCLDVDEMFLYDSLGHCTRTFRLPIRCASGLQVAPKAKIVFILDRIGMLYKAGVHQVQSTAFWTSVPLVAKLTDNTVARDLRISADEKLIAVLMEDRQHIRLYDANTLVLVVECILPFKVSRFRLLTNGETLIISEQHQLLSCDLRSGRTKDHISNRKYAALDVDHLEQHAAVSWQEGQNAGISILALPSYSETATTATPNVLYQVDCSRDGKSIGGYTAGRVMIWAGK